MAETVNAYRAEPYDYAEARALAEALELSEPVAITLVRRGYRTPEEARAFLEADEPTRRAPSARWRRSSSRCSARDRGGRRITVHGDFDVDGVCATAIMVGALRELGAECDWLIPDRIADGYGLDAENVQRLAERGTSLLITVDCGITAVEEVALAKSLGIDVIVTDHHQPAGELPDCPILHPEIDGYPFTELCGTGGRLEAAPRRCEGRSDAATAETDLDLVALATVADVVPLVGENRSIVRRGLEEIRRAQRPGMRALLAAAKVEPTQLDEGDLAFRLAPRINAAGRLYRADAGVELFLTEDAERAAEIATELSRANGERRGDRAGGVERPPRRHAASSPTTCSRRRRWWSPGRAGIPGWSGSSPRASPSAISGPAIVISLDGEGGGRGSGRSIPGFDLLAGSRPAPRTSPHSAATGPRPGSSSPPTLSTHSGRRSAPTPPPCSGRRTWSGPSGSTRWSAAPDSASTSPRSWSGWPRSGWATRGCGCWCRRRGSRTCGRWGRRGSTRASASAADRTGPSGSPSGVPASASRRVTRSTPRCASR